jgi:hypothetical protein
LDRPAPAEWLHERLSQRELKAVVVLATGKRLTDIATVNAGLTRFAVEH